MAAYLLLCVVFPFLMAYAAASDLLTMRISNRVTGLVFVGFLLYALVSGMDWSDLSRHLAAGSWDKTWGAMHKLMSTLMDGTASERPALPGYVSTTPAE